MEMIEILGATFALIDTLVGCGAIIATLMVMVKFPALLVAILLACWVLNRLSAPEPYDAHRL